MANIVLYLKADQYTEVMEPQVYVKDIASVYCADKKVCARAKSLKIFQFEKDWKKRCVVSILQVIEQIEQECPGICVENLGENAVLIELVKPDRHKGAVQWIKTAFVAAISFFGTGFTIMAFHNDISINKIFATVYEQVMGRPSEGYSILEISYSVGLAVGIILFFNHIGGRRITKDPTPLEVEMKLYETDVNQALIDTSDREGKTIDVS